MFNLNLGEILRLQTFFYRFEILCYNDLNFLLIFLVSKVNSFDGAGSVPTVAPAVGLSKGIKNISGNNATTQHNHSHPYLTPYNSGSIWEKQLVEEQQRGSYQQLDNVTAAVHKRQMPPPMIHKQLHPLLPQSMHKQSHTPLPQDIGHHKLLNNLGMFI